MDKLQFLVFIIVDAAVVVVVVVVIIIVFNTPGSIDPRE